jgi:hypothetical protein
MRSNPVFGLEGFLPSLTHTSAENPAEANHNTEHRFKRRSPRQSSQTKPGRLEPAKEMRLEERLARNRTTPVNETRRSILEKRKFPTAWEMKKQNRA